MSGALTPVDVVLATNRAGPYLPATLDSLLRQTYEGWNLFVVDDGSPDPRGLAAIVAAVPNATLIRQSALGVSAARNAGLDRGAAELVVFLDDDDVWVPTRLERQVEALESTPAAVACYSGGQYIDAAGVVTGSWNAHSATSHGFLGGRVPLPRIVTLMVRREAALRAGAFDTAYRQAEDHDFILRLAQLGEMVPVDAPLVHYRRHPGNASAAGALEGRASSRAMLLKQVRHAEAEGRRDTAELLRQNLARQAPLWAEDNLRQLRVHARRRALRELLHELSWLMSRDPRPAARVVLRRARARVIRPSPDGSSADL